MGMNDWDHAASPRRFAQIGRLGEVCRLGLATRGNTHLGADAVLEAIERGVNYLNWCRHSDGMREAIRSLGDRRRDVRVALQLDARDADESRRELEGYLRDLNTDYLDVVKYYYVEHADEWQQIIAPGGAAEALEEARSQDVVRAIGLTSHQRPLAAQIAESGRLDLLMIRYNAAHRGAERDVFPVTTQHQLPVIAFTCQRWGALTCSTPHDPPQFVPPAAPDWYRFALCHPAVSVALMAPDDRNELRENLTLLEDWRGLSPEQYNALCQRGDRVRRSAGSFP
jgi:predicted aldo/keto reductase-like oxidoreductase